MYPNSGLLCSKSVLLSAILALYLVQTEGFLHYLPRSLKEVTSEARQSNVPMALRQLIVMEQLLLSLRLTSCLMRWFGVVLLISAAFELKIFTATACVGVCVCVCVCV